MVDPADFLEHFDDFVLEIERGFRNSEQIDGWEGNIHVKKDMPGLHFDGDGDNVDIGRLTQFEQSEQLSLSVEFARDEADGSKQRLVWNHQKIGVELVKDGLVVKVANNDAKFHQGFKIKDLGLNDTDTHRITVLVDQDSDHLQVLVDDLLVLDETDTDFDFVGAGGGEWGWKLGTPWGNAGPDGVMTDFRIDDDFAFVGDQVIIDDAALVG